MLSQFLYLVIVPTSQEAQSLADILQLHTVTVVTKIELWVALVMPVRFISFTDTWNDETSVHHVISIGFPCLTSRAVLSTVRANLVKGLDDGCHHATAVCLDDNFHDTIDIPHRERHVGLLLDKPVYLLPELLGGVLLHVHLLEDDMPVVLLQGLLVFLVGDGRATCTLPLTADDCSECYWQIAVGLLDLLDLSSLFVNLILEVIEVCQLVYFLRCLHHFIETPDSRRKPVYDVTDKVILHETFLTSSYVLIELGEEIACKLVVILALLVELDERHAYFRASLCCLETVAKFL